MNEGRKGSGAHVDPAGVDAAPATFATCATSPQTSSEENAKLPKWITMGLHAVTFVVVAAYLGYLLLTIWRGGWTGDNHIYLAATRELLETWRPTRHEYLDLPASFSYAYTPYLYWVAFVGRMLDLPPYETLQIAAVINLGLYVSGVFTLLSCGVWRHKASPWWTGALFLAVSSLLRQEMFFLSSETALGTWGYVLHYPSGFAWCAFLWGMIAAERIVARRYAWALLLALCVWLGLTTHPLTGSWLFGIAGVRALFAIFHGSRASRRERLMPAALIIGTVMVAAALSLLWPNVSFLKSSIVAASAPSPLTDRPFLPFIVVYILAAVALVRGLVERDRATIWLCVGWLATAFAYGLMLIPGWDYRARYLFFALFFAQMLVSGRYMSDVVALLRLLFVRARSEPRFHRALFVPAACIVALVLGFVASPQDRLRNPPASVSALLAKPTGGDQVRRELDPIRHTIGPQDIFIAESLTLAMRLSAISGARLVAAKYAAQVPDMNKRQKDVSAFYDLKKDRAFRAAVVQRYKVTKVVISKRYHKHIALLKRELGEPLASSEYLHVFSASPYYAHPPSN